MRRDSHCVLFSKSIKQDIRAIEKAQSCTPTLEQGIAQESSRHLNVVVRGLTLVLNGEEMTLDFLQDSRIIVDHAALPAKLNRCVGNKQVFPALAIEVFDALLLIAVTSTEITAFRFH